MRSKKVKENIEKCRNTIKSRKDAEIGDQAHKPAKNHSYSNDKQKKRKVVQGEHATVKIIPFFLVVYEPEEKSKNRHI